MAENSGENTIGLTNRLAVDPVPVEAVQHVPLGTVPQMTAKLPVMICFGWGIGAVTGALLVNLFNLLVLRFATDFLGIAASVAGILLATSKLYDAVTDPVMGAVSDNWQSPSGRRRPFMLAAAVLCPIAVAALFFVPHLAGVPLLLYYLGALLLFSTVYTIWSVPYLAMSAEMTDDYHDRSRLISYRVYGGALGLVVSSMCGPWLLVYWGGGRAAYQGMAVVTGALALLTSLACHRLTRSAPFKLKTARQSLPLKRQIRLIFDNRPLTLLLVHKAFWYFGFAANQASLAFFIKHVAGLSDMWLGAYYIILPFGLIGSQPVWLWIAKRLEKKYASMLAMGMFGALELTWLLSGADENRLIIVCRLLGLGFAAGGAILLIHSMFNDTIEYDFRRNALRREGTFTGLFSFVEKTFSALGVAALGGFIGAMGYVSSTAGPGSVEQPSSAVVAIAVGFAVVPFCTAIASIIVIAFYDLNRGKLAGTGLRPT